MVLVATEVLWRRGTTEENDAFTGGEGEITVDTTSHEMRVHDGSTVGGHTIPTKNYSYSKTESDDLLSNKANVDMDNITTTGNEYIAHQAMPSGRYIDLTLGASGTTYTAPADGVFVVVLKASGTAWCNMSINNNIVAAFSTTSTSYYNGYFSVSKGDILKLEYSNCSKNRFRFVYAQGAQ